jgi:predicted lipoprotein
LEKPGDGFNHGISQTIQPQRKLSPLPAGEGQGEGERIALLISVESVINKNLKASADKKSVTRCGIMVLILAALCWIFPLFHIVPLKTATAEKAAAAFDATSVAENFWTNQLLPALKKTMNTDVLLPAIQSDDAAAKKKFSRSVGLSDSYFYFLSGTGRVVKISDDEISLAVTPGSTNAEISLQTGLIFGDAVRDGTGLLNVNDYPNSQDFNDLSAALNHLVETRVLPPLRQSAKIGATIFFTGCAEVDDEATDLKPLKVIPIQTKTE